MDGNRTQAFRRENEQKRDELFVSVAVEKGYLTQDQAEAVRRSVEASRKGGARRPASAVCAERGLVDRAGRLAVQQEMRRRGWRPMVGKYELIRKLGGGGMGTVYLARNVTIGRTVAVKILPARLGKNATYLSRFDREARLAARLSHPNIVQVLDADESDGRRYMVMEHIEGETLQARVEREGPLEESVAVSLLRQVASGLGAAHAAGIVHRDIKPANILIDKAGVPKIADLGIAKSADPSETALTQTAAAIGTPLYMAPEQTMSSAAVDARSDIYSLGATFYHALAGEPPFDGRTPYEIANKHCGSPRPDLREKRPEISPGLCAIIERMMARAPEERPQTCEGLIGLLDALVAGERIAPPPRAPAAGGRRPPRIAVLAAAGGAALLLVGIALGVVGLLSGGRGEPIAGAEAVRPDSDDDEWSLAAARRILNEALGLPGVAPDGAHADLARALQRLIRRPGDTEAAREAAEGLRALSNDLPATRRAQALLAQSVAQRQAGDAEAARETRTEAMRVTLAILLRTPAMQSTEGYEDLRPALERVVASPSDADAAREAAGALGAFMRRMPAGSPARRQAMLGVAAARYLAGDGDAWRAWTQAAGRPALRANGERGRGEPGGRLGPGRDRE